MYHPHDILTNPSTNQPTRKSCQRIVRGSQRLSWLWLLVWLNLAPAALAATDCTYPAPQSEIPQAQCQILLDLYNSTNGPAWADNATNNWNVTNTPCSWTGVTCSVGVVTGINRDSNNLTGTLPSSLSALTSLQNLTLWNNQLTGSIPDLSGLTSLQYLSLYSNQLTGSIPDLSGLTSLQYLTLWNNQLTGSIPDLSALTSLQYFFLDINQLTGSLPDLSALTSLQYFSLSGNQLTGSIPDLSALTSLQTLHLGVNQLTGSIPDLSALTNLVFLSLSDNRLTGSIPDLSALTSLQDLQLHNNQLTGSIPDLSALTSLQYLYLENNQLSGIIPDLSGTASTLGNVYLSCNQFTGETGGSATAKDPDWASTQFCNAPAPTGLTATPVSATQLNLSWTDNSTNETGFQIESPVGTLIHTTAANVTNYSHSGLICNTTYTYSLTATNAFGNSVAITGSATTLICPPGAPTGFTATAVSPTQINLSWTDNSANETGFKIESPAGTLIHTTAADVTTYSHSGLTCNTTYTYNVIATNAGGDSAAITGNAMTSPCLIIPQPGPAWIADLTPYQETGLGVRVELDGTGQGRVISSPEGLDCTLATPDQCLFSFKPTTLVTLTPLPAEGSEFTGWGGNEVCNNGTFLMNSGVLCIAYFRTLIHPVTLTVKGRGKVKGTHFDCQSDTTCTAYFREGTTLNGLVIRPRPGWTFAGWNGDCDNQGTVTVTKATQCQATFLDDPNIPNEGDGNGDGLKDAYQDHVVSLPDEFTGDYLTLEVDKNCVIEDMYTDLLDVLPDYDQTRQYAQGLLYFDIVCANTTVTLYLHRINKILRPFTLQKYGPTVPGDASTICWYSLPNVTFDVVKVGTQSVLRVRYDLVDGQLGDNTGVDGHIIDPAVVMEAP